MSAPPIRRWDRETALLAWLAACVSIFSFLFYFRRGDILLYGDAVAHINIARRVFDSRTPGLLQLGTVWLPLPHLLMIPFLLSDWMWKTGLADRFRRWQPMFSERSEFSACPRCAGFCPRTGRDGTARSLGRGDHLCGESKSDLSASHRHDRTFVPGTVHLGGGPFQ